MRSRVINAPSRQITLELEPGMSDRYGSLREVVAAGTYQRGLKRVAADLDQAPSNLSVQLSDDPARRLSVEALERYIETQRDYTPIYYLIDKYLSAEQDAQASLAEAREAFKRLAPALKKAGLL